MARWCAEQGWPVHPLAPGRKTPVSNCSACKERTHQPGDCACLPAGRPCHGFHAATTNLALIDSWWSRTPAWGVGIACGGADLVVIDVDAHSAQVPDRGRLLPGIPIHDSVNLRGLASGFDTLALLAALRGQPSPAEDTGTLRVRTPSGGMHVWYRNPSPAIRLRCSTGSSTKVALAWQVDVRADGGYIVSPTTCVAQGTYRPEGPARLPAPLPEWLREELVRTGHVIQPRPTPVPGPAAVPRGASVGIGRGARGLTADGHRVLEPLLADVAACAGTPEGAAFTEKLNKAAYTAGGLAAAGHLDAAAAHALLSEAAETARPRQSARNARIIDDGLAAGAARPLRLKGRS
ncbi:bifunctional DNA primase/polymerase [Streptomyces sp. MZ04]|uniref:bifunctional DNA primase/polymerase n=1 Tax=Streptomyces sp. MZ04 TaxID=2559236 RepID=UPI00107ED646|nr:bifunctional DNA primase/polymerase [Streptomyces sp. MZ04]TGB02077.1 bifunctional DNA primase/polymerase [Streptomyces sp. MZ04]